MNIMCEKLKEREPGMEPHLAVAKKEFNSERLQVGAVLYRAFPSPSIHISAGKVSRKGEGEPRNKATSHLLLAYTGHWCI